MRHERKGEGRKDAEMGVALISLGGQEERILG